MTCNRLHAAADQWVLGALHEEDLSAVAIEALEEGLDSPKLRMLAGWTLASALDPQRLFRDALEESGVALRSRDQILRERALPVVQAVAKNELHVSLLAETLNRAVGTDVTSSNSPLYSLWCYACDFHCEERYRTLFEDLAKKEALTLLQRFESADPLFC
ncbi:MAG TPA: hypothetical protein VGR35_08455 [Tepidisphaeraceae bacterium]|nr:hypothetical protein [Tepidisphaeraceae bacterium]